MVRGEGDRGREREGGGRGANWVIKGTAASAQSAITQPPPPLGEGRKRGAAPLPHHLVFSLWKQQSHYLMGKKIIPFTAANAFYGSYSVSIFNT